MVFEIFFTSFAVPPNADAATDDNEDAAGVRNDTMGSSGANFVQKSVYDVGSAHFIDHLRIQGGCARLRFYCC